ncbi:hypothetical protein [Nitrosopumilus oxyclinae]|uniref:hypothetical protein n=1 Tax=Nitrosopumilus oxyclinae TaxID=1959104 RepID=UPI0015C97F50|nr:hypothetical protein [Nitrosopumilus oxyclinae]
MGKIKLIGISILVIIIILGILFAYSYTHLSINLKDVEFQSIDWETLTWSNLLNVGLDTLSGDWFNAAFGLIQGINLNFIFNVNNNGFLPVYIPDLYYDILINDIRIGRGNSNIDTTIYPGETKEIISFQNIQKNSFSPAINSIVSTQGIMEIKVRGTAYFKIFGMNIPIPFESSKQISIYDEVRNKINSEIQKNQPQNDGWVSTTAKNPLENVLNSITTELFGAEDLELSLSGQTIVDSTYKVTPKSYSHIYFTLECTANIKGGFIANALLGNDIVVFILNEENFKKFKEGQNASTHYKSNKVESGAFDVTLVPGEYYIIISNEHSMFSTKTVQLQAASTCS